MRTLFEQIIKEALEEGGQAISSAQDVRGDLAGKIAHELIGAISNVFGCDASPVGSTGKKGPDAYSGDIDILLNMPWEEKNEEVAEWVKQEFPGCEMKIQPGFKQISFGYPYNEDGGEEKVAQVDLMFTTNFEWRKFSMASPSPKESRFKGLVRTVLLKHVTKVIPMNDPDGKYADEFYGDDEFDGKFKGQLKGYWRYMWDDERGVVIAYRTNVGKRGPRSAFETPQDKKVTMAHTVKDGIHLIFGPEVTMEDLYSPETIVAFLFSGKYPYDDPETLQKIHDGVVNTKQVMAVDGAVEAFEELWGEYAGEPEEQPQVEPAYSSSINENRRFRMKMRDLIRRMK